MGFPFEHGLHSTLIAMRIADRLGVGREDLGWTYYACLLSHSGCTTDAHVAPEVFGASLTTHLNPVVYGSRLDVLGGLIRALPDPGGAAPVRAFQVARRFPRMAREQRQHLTASCEVAGMLAERARPLPVGARPARSPARALGRQGTARSRQGRADPASDADRAARRRCRLPAAARRRGARRAPRPRAPGPCVRPGGGRLPHRRRRADPRAQRPRLGLGGDARVRAARRRCCWRARRSIARSARWAASPISSRPILRVTPPAWRSSPLPRRSAVGSTRAALSRCAARRSSTTSDGWPSMCGSGRSPGR